MVLEILFQYSTTPDIACSSPYLFGSRLVDAHQVAGSIRKRARVRARVKRQLAEVQGLIAHVPQLLTRSRVKRFTGSRTISISYSRNLQIIR